MARRRHCRWDVPDGTCSVALDSKLMDDLRRRTIRAFLSLPKRGAEIGGFLFGHVRQEEPVTFEIDTCEEIKCEYRFGPSYRLSESDYRRLSERMAQLRHDGCRPVIGLYRTYTGRDIALDQTDQELVRHLFPNQRIVSLLLQPISPERCIARFQFVNDGEPAVEGLYEPFLFEPSQLKVESVDEPEPLEAAAAASVSAGPVAVEATEPARPMLVPLPAPAVRHLRLVEDEEPPAVRKSSPWPLLVWCILAVMAGAVGYQLWVLERQPRWAPLGLAATASAQDVVLSWNPAAPAIQQAAQGVMNVTDGSVQNQIPLTAAQLHAGKLHYAASHENLLFRLLVYDEGKHAAGDSLYFARVLPAEAAPVHAAAPAAAPVVAAPVVETPTDDTAQVGTPAVARRQVQPEIPAGIRARVRSRIVVPVQVHIDAAGRVTGAVSKSSGSGLDRYLADQAVKAARKWSFRPARSRRGRAVASAKSVEFVFEPAR
jgi:TonB family protein